MQQTERSSIDQVMRSGLDTVFPAACLLVIHDGKVLWHEAYGYLDPETRRVPARVDTPFDLASLTKLFTFTAFMRLVEAGRVALDDLIVQVIPEFGGGRPVGPAEEPLSKTVLPAPETYRGLTVDASRITFRHLLTHSSGLPAWRSVYQAAGPGTVEQRRQRALAAICSWDFFYPTGTRVVYSDLGFMLLGEAVSRLHGAPLEGCLQDLVLAPLGLRDTGFRPVRGVPWEERGGQAASLARRPAWEFAPTEICTIRGYRLMGEVDDENCAGLGGIAGHAGLFATAADVAALCHVYASGGRPLLQPETVAEMAREQAALPGAEPSTEGHQRRGLGWALAGPTASCGPDFGRRAFGHTGFTGTSAWIDPDRRLVVVLLTNRVYYGRDLGMPIQRFRPSLHSAVVQALSERGGSA